MTLDGISVIICCYNSKNKLPSTLYHLSKQIVNPNINWEIIIVDNNSTDDTSRIAQKEWDKLNLDIPLRILFENNAGLSQARETGVNNAKYKYIIFCDDDNWLDPNYISIAFNLISSNQEIGILGGQSIAKTDGKFPDWWDTYKNSYAIGKQNDITGDVSNRQYLWGAGMVFKKELFLKAYDQLPSLLTDRNGINLSSGGDSEFCKRILFMGYKLYYEKRLKFIHFIPSARLKDEYRINLLKGIEECNATLSVYSMFLNLKNKVFFERILLIAFSLLRIIISYLGFYKKWNTEYEKTKIFILSNYKFSEVNSSILKINSVCKKLTKSS